MLNLSAVGQGQEYNLREKLIDWNRAKQKEGKGPVKRDKKQLHVQRPLTHILGNPMGILNWVSLYICRGPEG